MPVRPLWLLDVDGVLNAVAHVADRSVWTDWQEGAARAGGVDWPILFSPTAMRAVRSMHEDGLAEIRWLTTWRTAANDSLRHLVGLPAFPVEGMTPPGDQSPSSQEGDVHESVASHGGLFGQRGSEWWKLTVVREVVDRQGGDRPLVWTDDDLRFEPEAAAWVRDHVRTALLVAPSTRTGLAPEDLQTIRSFCEAHS